MNLTKNQTGREARGERKSSNHLHDYFPALIAAQHMKIDSLSTRHENSDPSDPTPLPI